MRSIKSLIKKAIDLHGGRQSQLAEALGCSQQQVSYLLRANSISAEMALKLDAATNGVVSRHTLRPDIYGPAPAKSEAA